MSSIQYPITLDLKRDYHQVLIMKEGDVDSREIIITIVDNGKIFDITNHRIEFKWHKPDNTLVHGDCTETDGQALIKCDEQMLLVGGIAKCEVVLYDLDNETVLSTMSFDISIRDSVVSNKDIESSSEFLSLSNLLFAANGMFNTLKEHISDVICHITDTERANWNDAYDKRHTHSNKEVLDNTTANYTTEEKDKLFDIEAGAEVNVQVDWDITDATSDAYIKNKPSVYTKNEVDNKFSALETNIDWKESVATYDDIATTYQNPEDGWTVNVNDTDYTYRYNGTSWVAISANAIPKATSDVDGLLTKEDYSKISSVENGAEVNQNAFSNVVVGSTTVAADSKTDTLTIVEGDNVSITANSDTDKITISSSHENISTSTDTTSTASPSAGGTFTTVDSVIRDSNGHVTKVNTKTVTLPNTSVTVDDSLSNISENPVQNKVVNSALETKADNIYYNEDTDELQLRYGTKVLSTATIKGGGGAKIPPKATVNPAIVNGNAKVTITWGDPEDVVADGVLLSTWKGTKLVMSETGYPENENDGTVLVDNTERDAYKTSGYEVASLTNGNTYYFKLFPYSTDGIYNYQDSNNLLGTPSLVKLDACTDMSINAEMGSVTVSWTDPDAEKTVDGNTVTWDKTVLVYKQGSTAPSSVSDGIVAVEETTRNQYSVDGFTVDGLTDGEQYSFSLFAVSTEGASSDATKKSVSLWATLTITTGETTLYEKEVTVSCNSNTASGTFSSSGTLTLQIPWIGETTITSTDGTDTATSKVTISAYETSYSKELSFLKIVTFADGTDEEILAMIQAHYDNKINVADYWAVGDTRNVNLSAMEATYVGESHRAQTVQYRISDFEHYDLATEINGHTKAAILVDQVNCLMDAECEAGTKYGSSNTENGYMNSSNTNSGGWGDCARRKWCNEVYLNAMPEILRNAVKEVKIKTSAGNQSTTIVETNDKIFLPSEVEIFGSTSYSAAGEGSQYAYYKNATANRYKLPKWGSSNASNIYWERSPYGGHSARFCSVDDDGSANSHVASAAYGVAPCLCI